MANVNIYRLVRHIPSGEVYVLSSVEGVCGPLNHADFQDDDGIKTDWAYQGFDFSHEDDEWAESQEWNILEEVTP